MSLSFLSFFQPSLKSIVYCLLLFSFGGAMCGLFIGNAMLVAVGTISMFLVIVLFTDRKEPVNMQTTKTDTIVTGVALRILMPLGTAALTAFGVLSLFLNSGFEKTGLGFLLLPVTAGIFYAIRITGDWLESKNWKLSLYDDAF